MGILRSRHTQNQQQENAVEEAVAIITALAAQGGLQARSHVPLTSDPGGCYDEEGNWKSYFRCDADGLDGEAGLAP